MRAGRYDGVLGAVTKSISVKEYPDKSSRSNESGFEVMTRRVSY